MRSAQVAGSRPLTSGQFSSPRRSSMSLSPHRRSLVNEPPPPAAIRFECNYGLDARGSATLELSGELDAAVCGDFESRLAEAQRASGVVTVDMRNLTFMDSAGYAVLVWAARASRPDAKLILTGCAGQVSRLLCLVGLPEKVEMQASRMLFAVDTAADSSAASPGSEASVGP